MRNSDNPEIISTLEDFMFSFKSCLVAEKGSQEDAGLLGEAVPGGN
jgi:hypothetical protein